MGINSSMFTAMTGLKGSETMVDVVGNNLANVNTVGFKASEVQFATQIYQTMSYGSSPYNDPKEPVTLAGTNPKQVGMGVKVASINANHKQGTVEISNKNSDIAIDGKGFFIVQGSYSNQNYYTRNGVFQTNEDKFLTTTTGQYILGRSMNSSGKVTTGPLEPVFLDVDGDEIVHATTNVTLDGILSCAGEPTTQGTILESDVMTDSLKTPSPGLVANSTTGQPTVGFQPATDALGNPISGALNKTASYRYMAVYSGTHADGTLWQSKPTPMPASVTTPSGAMAIDMGIPTVDYFDLDPRVDGAGNPIIYVDNSGSDFNINEMTIYRTTAAEPSQFYKVGDADIQQWQADEDAANIPPIVDPLDPLNPRTTYLYGRQVPTQYMSWLDGTVQSNVDRVGDNVIANGDTAVRLPNMDPSSLVTSTPSGPLTTGAGAWPVAPDGLTNGAAYRYVAMCETTTGVQTGFIPVPAAGITVGPENALQVEFTVPLENVFDADGDGNADYDMSTMQIYRTVGDGADFYKVADVDLAALAAAVGFQPYGLPVNANRVNWVWTDPVAYGANPQTASNFEPIDVVSDADLVAANPNGSTIPTYYVGGPIVPDPISYFGTLATENTNMVDVEIWQRDGIYTQPFQAGTLDFTGIKGNRELATKEYEIFDVPLVTTNPIEPSTLKEFGRDFLPASLGLVPSFDTIPDPPGDPPATSPYITGAGGMITDGKIVLTGNTGTDNAIEINLASMKLTPTGEQFASPVDLDFDAVQDADGASTQRDFVAYTSTGLPVDVNLTFVMETNTEPEMVWRWYADSPLNDLHSDLFPSINAGTGLIRFNSLGEVQEVDDNDVTVYFNKLGEEPLNFDLDFFRLSGVADEPPRVNVIDNDGYPPGVLQDWQVEENGRITGVYTNGRQLTIAQLYVAEFINPEGLLQMGNNLYAEGVNSGGPQFKIPGVGSAGTLVGGALELSNTDIGDDLINLILATTMYRSNAKVVSTAQEMLNELLMLKR